MKRYVLSLAVILLLPACVVGPDYQRPDVVTPKRWSVPTASAAQSKALERWWQNFNDPILNQLIVYAFNANLDLKQTVDRI